MQDCSQVGGSFHNHSGQKTCMLKSLANKNSPKDHHKIKERELVCSLFLLGKEKSAIRRYNVRVSIMRWTMSIDEMRKRMDKSVDHFRSKIDAIYGATLNTGVIDSIRVPYQNQNIPISDLGFSSKNGQNIDVQIYDPEVVGLVTKAIQNQGHNAYASKNVVRVGVPLASGETREKNKKRVAELAEEARVSVRQVRQESRKKILKAAGSEDEEKQADKDIQTNVDAVTSMIDKLMAAKINSL